MLRMMAGARPLVGSSIRISSRRSMMAREIASICFCPPDSAKACLLQNFSIAGNSANTRPSRSSSNCPLVEASRMFSSTVSPPKMPMFSGT